jgi:hypothetical protein
MAKTTTSKVQIGQKVGHWLIKSEPLRVGRDLRYLCECVCGNQRKVSAISLRAGHSTSCGCMDKMAGGGVSLASKDNGKITPEIQMELSLISGGYLPPADQFCVADGAPTWKLASFAKLLGISKDELVMQLNRNGNRFSHDPITELSV